MMNDMPMPVDSGRIDVRIRASNCGPVDRRAADDYRVNGPHFAIAVEDDEIRIDFISAEGRTCISIEPDLAVILAQVLGQFATEARLGRRGEKRSL